VTSKLSRFIRSRCDDTARTVATDEHRLPADFGMIELLDRREEGVHIDVEDGAVAEHAIILSN
jgi:hypothetical protein